MLSLVKRLGFGASVAFATTSIAGARPAASFDGGVKPAPNAASLLNEVSARQAALLADIRQNPKAELALPHQERIYAATVAVIETVRNNPAALRDMPIKAPAHAGIVLPHTGLGQALSDSQSGNTASAAKDVEVNDPRVVEQFSANLTQSAASAIFANEQSAEQRKNLLDIVAFSPLFAPIYTQMQNGDSLQQVQNIVEGDTIQISSRRIISLSKFADDAKKISQPVLDMFDNASPHAVSDAFDAISEKHAPSYMLPPSQALRPAVMGFARRLQADKRQNTRSNAATTAAAPVLEI